jgi:diguanylate cyclase (GGDEF)-like protein
MRILIVDDDDDMRKVIRVALEPMALDFREAVDGVKALQMVRAERPDLVILDIEMPLIDGHEVCRTLKADAATRDIPVIFVTAHGDEVTETRGLDDGAVDFIAKPINAGTVRARVRRHLMLKAESDRLRGWVYVDSLTGLHNRRHFDEQLTAEWGRAVRNNTALSVVLLDVDFFKPYNDRYGHQAGDDCLRRVATALKATLRRPGDLVARYGGEEFACLLPHTDLNGALQVARQLGQQVFAQGIEHADSSAASVVTVSLGVCTKREQASGTAGELLRQADAQLYAAKERGRNQVSGIALGREESGSLPLHSAASA